MKNWPEKPLQLGAAVIRVAIGLALIAVPAAGVACPPPPIETPENSAEMQREREAKESAFKEYARASGVVYGVLETRLGYDEKRQDPDRVGTFRILHVYSGQYR